MSIFGLAFPEILSDVVVVVVVDGLLLKLLLADGVPSKLKPPPVAGVAGDDAADAALFKFVFKALLLLALPKPKDEKFNPGDPALPLLLLPSPGNICCVCPGNIANKNTKDVLGVWACVSIRLKKKVQWV